MTVKELIEHLQTLPQDFMVAYELHSETKLMEPDEIRVVRMADKKLVKHHNMPDWLRAYSPYEWEKGGSKSGLTPEFVNAIVFPGN